MNTLSLPGIGNGQVDTNQTNGHTWYVDGTNGLNTNSGKAPRNAFKTIQKAVTAAAAFDTIYVVPKAIAAGDTDPNSYAETIIIPVATCGLKIIGLGGSPAQGQQPQIKIGAGSTAMLTIRAPGCLIKGLTFNGGSSTGGGILLDDDASTKTAFGTVIEDCYFKNCQGAAAAATGGAIMWASTGGAWQVRIQQCRFYENRCGIMKLGSSVSKPKEVVIKDCEFASSANTVVDGDIYFGVATGAGAGVISITVDNCNFATVDVPAYASSPDAAVYMDLTGSSGIVSNCKFACIVQGTSAKTFKAAGSAVKIPATVRMVGCTGEAATDSTVTAVSRVS